VGDDDRGADSAGARGDGIDGPGKGDHLRKALGVLAGEANGEGGTVGVPGEPSLATRKRPACLGGVEEGQHVGDVDTIEGRVERAADPIGGPIAAPGFVEATARRDRDQPARGRHGKERLMPGAVGPVAVENQENSTDRLRPCGSGPWEEDHRRRATGIVRKLREMCAGASVGLPFLGARRGGATPGHDRRDERGGRYDKNRKNPAPEMGQGFPCGDEVAHDSDGLLGLVNRGSEAGDPARSGLLVEDPLRAGLRERNHRGGEGGLGGGDILACNGGAHLLGERADGALHRPVARGALDALTVALFCGRVIGHGCVPYTVIGPAFRSQAPAVGPESYDGRAERLRAVRIANAVRGVKAIWLSFGELLQVPVFSTGPSTRSAATG